MSSIYPFVQVLIRMCGFICFAMVATTAKGQRLHGPTSAGIKASFGVHAFTLASDIDEINRMPIQVDGGTVGVFAGNDLIRTSVNIAGFYYSSGNVPRTFDYIISDVTASVYPLALRNKKRHLHPYLNAGLGFSRLKFFGHYLQNDPSQQINYSAPEPYLGKRKTLSAAVGAGIEYRLPAFELLHLFAEGSLSKPLTTTGDGVFHKTSPGDGASIHVGVAFGIRNR